MNGDAVLTALNSLRDQILKDHVGSSADYDTAAVMHHVRRAIDSIQHERGSAIEGDFRTQGGGGNPL